MPCQNIQGTLGIFDSGNIAIKFISLLKSNYIAKLMASKKEHQFAPPRYLIDTSNLP